MLTSDEIIDDDMEIHSMCAYDADAALEPMSVEYEPLDDERSDTEENESEEIASNGEVDQWFIERAVEFEFYLFMPTCSRCLNREALYIGVTQHRTPFQFCCICHDDLVRRADTAKQSPERFGV